MRWEREARLPLLLLHPSRQSLEPRTCTRDNRAMTATPPDPRDQSPLKLYKYKSIAGDAAKWVEKMVCEHEAYFAAPSSFNDPFDCAPSFSFEGTDEQVAADYLRISRKFNRHWSDEELRRDAQDLLADPERDPRTPTVRARIQAAHALRIRNEVGVFCVTPHPNNVLMWSHYADSHRGVCLEFDGAGKFMAHAHRVLYLPRREPINPYRDSFEVMMEKALLTKDSRWAYEDEWRLIDHKLGPGARAFRPRNLTGIIVGHAARPETLDLMRGWIRARSEPLHLYQACTSDDTYEVGIIKLDA